MPDIKLTNSTNQKETIKISIPLRVAHNGKLLKKSLAKLAEQIGHQGCFSGVNCLFQLHKDFVVDPEANVHEARLDSIPARHSITSSGQLVTASLSKNEMMSIDQISSISEKILDMRGGCNPCHSGFDFMFQQELELFSR